MYASGPSRIEGMLSGKSSLFGHYELIRFKSHTQLNWSGSENGPVDALARLERKFLSDILERVATEKRRRHGPVNRTSGEFYLKRWQPGSQSTDSDCVTAVGRGVVDARFVGRLSAWDFLLYRQS
jgi:hypothetical protein